MPPSSPTAAIRNTRQRSTRQMKENKKKMSKAYSVLYDSGDHFSVLTQMWGSVWPRVLPYCIFNVSVMAALSIFSEKFADKLQGLHITTQGHAFIAAVVAFLLISRINTALGRFNECRSYLGVMYRETRELIATMAVFTDDDDSIAAKEWRQEVTYRMLLLLRTSMAVVDYPSDFIPPWELPELSGVEKEDIQQNTYLNSDVLRFCHDKDRSEFEEAMRVPVRISYLVNKAIHSNGTRLSTPIAAPREMKLIGSVSSFMGAYYGVRKFLTTPVPFPLVQMARTFLFFYIFTVPFALLSDNSTIVAHCVEVFIITYGFMGLELTAIEMDNPFGDDENDFDNMALAYVCMEDTYLTLASVDGPEWSAKLRERMNDPLLESNEGDAEPSEGSNLLV